MRIEELYLYNFRNYSQLNIKFDNNFNIFIGNNAQGKTNILEAIYLSSIGSSYRSADDSELIKIQEEFSRLELLFKSRSSQNKLVFKFFKHKKKEIYLNSNLVKLKEIIGQVNAILFSPEDLWLVKGNPAMRRKFLDNEISQASPLYYRQLLEYNRILVQRNNLLKSIRAGTAKTTLLDIWDEQFSKAAVLLFNKRQEALKKINMLANLMHRKLTVSKENLAVQYVINNLNKEAAINYSEWLKAKLQEIGSDDIRRGTTSAGPHRDDLVFYVNGRNLKLYGSQGQQRTGIIALKIAEIEYLKAETGEYPVLLLDDVMSELDKERRCQLLGFIKDRIQTFITATDEAFFPEIQSGHYYNVSNGIVEG